MWLPYVLATACVTVLAVAGSQVTEIGPWYRELKKPSWNPPDWVFPVVWTTVFLLLVIALGQAWIAGSPADRQLMLWLTGVNFVLNFLWSLLFFKMRRPAWALIEAVIFWLSVLAMVVHFATFHPFSAWLLAPYLVWVGIASVLNMRIVQLNAGTGTAAAT